MKCLLAVAVGALLIAVCRYIREAHRRSAPPDWDHLDIGH